jgi:hypothetical protein
VQTGSVEEGKMEQLTTSIDHLVVVADTLEQGRAYIEKTLGVSMLNGGEHPKMGTHNCLLNLGNEVYLEVIAINPAATALPYSRWFGMDEPHQRQRVVQKPFLATFVAKTNDIATACSLAPEVGLIRSMERARFQWQITVRDDGALVEGGTMPILIEWPGNVHPTHGMPNSGCRLLRLDVFHARPKVLETHWQRIGLLADDHLVLQEAESDGLVRLMASISTPNGIRHLE